MSRILSSTDLQSWKPKSDLVFTNGCFDILHVGHVEYLQQARQLGSSLFVGINSDASVRRLKGDKRPIQNQKNRAKLLASLECVDYVAVFEEDTPMELIKTVSPKILVKGGDWSVDQIVGSDYVLSKGGEVQSLKFIEGQSTTDIIQLILEAYR